MVLVVDASLALAIAFGELAPDQESGIFMRILSERAVVPALWRWEFANGLIQGIRTGRVHETEASNLLAEFRSLPIDIDFASMDIAWESAIALAIGHGLTAYDAAYLELAIRRGLPLGSLDDALVRAAKAEGVEVIGT